MEEEIKHKTFSEQLLDQAEAMFIKLLNNTEVKKQEINKWIKKYARKKGYFEEKRLRSKELYTDVRDLQRYTSSALPKVVTKNKFKKMTVKQAEDLVKLVKLSNKVEMLKFEIDEIQKKDRDYKQNDKYTKLMRQKNIYVQRGQWPIDNKNDPLKSHLIFKDQTGFQWFAGINLGDGRCMIPGHARKCIERSAPYDTDGNKFRLGKKIKSLPVYANDSLMLYELYDLKGNKAKGNVLKFKSMSKISEDLFLISSKLYGYAKHFRWCAHQLTEPDRLLITKSSDEEGILQKNENKCYRYNFFSFEPNTSDYKGMGGDSGSMLVDDNDVVRAIMLFGQGGILMSKRIIENLNLN